MAEQEIKKKNTSIILINFKKFNDSFYLYVPTYVYYILHQLKKKKLHNSSVNKSYYILS